MTTWVTVGADGEKTFSRTDPETGRWVEVPYLVCPTCGERHPAGTTRAERIKRAEEGGS